MLSVVRDTLLFILIIGGLALPFMRAAARLAPEERLGLGVAGALLTVYLFATAIYLAGLDPRWYWLLPPAALLAGLGSRPQLAALWHDADLRAAGTGWLIVAAWCLALTALITSYAGGRWAGDWHEHYERALFFVKHWPADHLFISVYPLPARPPLANLVTGALLALGQPDYARYQVITCLLSTLVIFPLLAIGRMFGGTRVAWLLPPALMLSPLFTQNTTFAWTKLPAAFFVLAAIPLLGRSLREPRDRFSLPVAAALLAAGCLTHYSAAVWVVGLGLGWVMARRRQPAPPALGPDFIVAGLTVTLLLATWFGWAVVRYGPGSTFGSNTAVGATQGMTTDTRVQVAANNLLRTFVPHPLLGTSEPALLQSDPAAITADWFFHLYQETLPLAWGLAGLALGGLAWARRQDGATPPDGWRGFWWWALPMTVALGIVTHTQPSLWGLVHISLQPLVLLGLAWLVAGLPETWRRLPGWGRAVVVVLGLVDFIGGVALHFMVQADVPARLARLSFPARANFAGKVRLNQPFLADNLAGSPWLPLLLLGLLLALAGWRAARADAPGLRTF